MSFLLGQMMLAENAGFEGCARPGGKRQVLPVDIETLRAFELAPGIVREDITRRRIANGWARAEVACGRSRVGRFRRGQRSGVHPSGSVFHEFVTRPSAEKRRQGGRSPNGLGGFRASLEQVCAAVWARRVDGLSRARAARGRRALREEPSTPRRRPRALRPRRNGHRPR